VNGKRKLPAMSSCCPARDPSSQTGGSNPALRTHQPATADIPRAAARQRECRRDSQFRGVISMMTRSARRASRARRRDVATMALQGRPSQCALVPMLAAWASTASGTESDTAGWGALPSRASPPERPLDSASGTSNTSSSCTCSASAAELFPSPAPPPCGSCAADNVGRGACNRA